MLLPPRWIDTVSEWAETRLKLIIFRILSLWIGVAITPVDSIFSSIILDLINTSPEHLQ